MSAGELTTLSLVGSIIIGLAAYKVYTLGQPVFALIWGVIAVIWAACAIVNFLTHIEA